MPYNISFVHKINIKSHENCSVFWHESLLFNKSVSLKIAAQISEATRVLAVSMNLYA